MNFRLNFDPFTPSGCRYSDTIIYGGCFSKQKVAIQLSYSMRRCLKIGVNNCSQPTIQLENLCDEDMVIEDTIYRPDNTYVYLKQNNNPGLVLHKGNIEGLPFIILSYVTDPQCN